MGSALGSHGPAKRARSALMVASGPAKIRDPDPYSYTPNSFSRQLVNKGASGGVAEFGMHARYQEVAVPTDLVLALGAKRSRY